MHTHRLGPEPTDAVLQGGSFTDPSYYFWKRWTGPAWLRPSISATWGSSLEAGWGPFEFIDMCEAAGILPVVTTTAESTGGGHGVGVLPACCAPEDMADLIEYTYVIVSHICCCLRRRD